MSKGRNSQPRVLVVASKAGYQTRAFDEAASRLGVSLVLATDRCHVLDDPWRDRAIPVRFDQLDEAADSVKDADAGPFDGIVAVGDRPAQLAARIAERLKLRFHPAQAADAACNKFIARGRFAAAGLDVPRFFRVRSGSNAGDAAGRAPFPCVLKPLGLSGSRGVIRANDRVEFAAAFRRIEQLMEEPEVRRLQSLTERFIQIEEYISGREFAIEGVLRDGRLQKLALFDKPDPLEGPFFEETIYVTPSREPAAVQRELVKAAQQAAAALGLSNGPVHAELRRNQAGIWPLEVAPRPIGGLCARALRFEPDLPLEELLLRHALGENTAAAALAAPASGVMMIPVPRHGIYASVEGEREALEVPLIDSLEITAKIGQEFRPLPEGDSYLGFLFASGPDPARVEQALRDAHAKLRFAFRTVLPVTRTSAL